MQYYVNLEASSVGSGNETSLLTPSNIQWKRRGFYVARKQGYYCHFMLYKVSFEEWLWLLVYALKHQSEVPASVRLKPCSWRELR